MGLDSFVIDTSEENTSWVELEGGKIAIHRTSHQPEPSDEVLFRWDVDTVHNILSWATQGRAVTAYLTGPLAHQIREHSKELGMTPEMFVWYAVKVFIETGTSP